MKKQTAKKGSRKKKAVQVPVRSFSKLVRFALVMLPIGLAALVASFAFSMMPSYASAWSWHPHDLHSGDALYEQCHNHLDDNQGHGIDLKDPACATVDNDAPEALNQNLVTGVGVATSTALGALDADDDLLYFEISALPQHGTLTASFSFDGPAFTLDNLPTVTYTPDPGYAGPDSFDFRVNDGQEDEGDIDVATVSITVEAAPEPEAPACDEGYHLSDDECVADEPAPLACSDTQHAEDNQCVDNPSDEEPSAPQSSGTGSGGGGGGVIISGPLSIGFVNTNPSDSSGGQVLGASTEASLSCSPLLSTYLRQGMRSDEVKKLQEFLNKELGLSIPVTGYFGPQTHEAVKAFQLKYADQVLKPWVPFGLQTDKTPTGYVYKTTQRMVNMLSCSALDLPQPQLP
jgi:hypothetical protein